VCGDWQARSGVRAGTDTMSRMNDEGDNDEDGNDHDDDDKDENDRQAADGRV
jgi:hypothetical protein